MTLSGSATAPAMTADEVVRFDPHWCLFWSRRVRSYQLETWIRYMKRSRFRFAITLRWRKWPIPLRIPFEMTLLASRLRRRSSSP